MYRSTHLGDETMFGILNHYHLVVIAAIFCLIIVFQCRLKPK